MWEKRRLQMDRPDFARQLGCRGFKSDFWWNPSWKAPKWVVLRPVGVWNNQRLCFMEKEAAVVWLWQKLEWLHDCKQAVFSEIGYISSSKDEKRLAVKAADWLWREFVTCRRLVTGVRSRPFYRPKSDWPICDSNRHLSRFILTGPSLFHFPQAVLYYMDVGNKSHGFLKYFIRWISQVKIIPHKPGKTASRAAKSRVSTRRSECAGSMKTRCNIKPN